MSRKQQSVAPKERVNITYKPATGDAQEEVELPLKILMIGDFVQRPDETPVESRKPINVDKDNFSQVMASQQLAVTFNTEDKLSGDDSAKLPVNLKFDSLADFGPDSIVKQVPELRKLVELRSALQTLKGPMGNTPAFKKLLQKLLGDAEARQKLIEELGICADADGSDTD